MKADETMANYLFPLGRKHFSYGSNVEQMELLSVVMVDSLMAVYEKSDAYGQEDVFSGSTNGEVSKEQYDLVHEALFAFFKVIVYWLQNGFKYVQNRGMD